MKTLPRMFPTLSLVALCVIAAPVAARSPAPFLSLTVEPSEVVGGLDAVGQVGFLQVSLIPLEVQLTSSDPDVAAVAPSLTMHSRASFSITTQPVNSARSPGK